MHGTAGLVGAERVWFGRPQTDPPTLPTAYSSFLLPSNRSAKIFRRDQAAVTDLRSMQALMRSNDWRSDPVRGCCCCCTAGWARRCCFPCACRPRTVSHRSLPLASSFPPAAAVRRPPHQRRLRPGRPGPRKPRAPRLLRHQSHLLEPGAAGAVQIAMQTSTPPPLLAFVRRCSASCARRALLPAAVPTTARPAAPDLPTTPQLQSEVVNGPTSDGWPWSVPAFRWSEPAAANITHRGQPERFAFTFQRMDPAAPLPASSDAACAWPVAAQA